MTVAIAPPMPVLAQAAATSRTRTAEAGVGTGRVCGGCGTTADRFAITIDCTKPATVSPILGDPMVTPLGPSYDPSQVLVMVLAGGAGKGLYPLTLDRAKPAVPFAGRYRIIDIVLSNFVNSGLSRIKVLTQYKSASLEEHIARVWRLSPMLDQYIETI